MAISINHKTCSACNREFPISAFGRSKMYRDGHRNQCTPCRVQKNREYLKTPAGQASLKRRIRKPRTSEQRRKDNWGSRLRKRGVGEKEYSRMLEQQCGRCALCETDRPVGRYQTFHVDHCHETERIRGLLCHKCNLGLALLGDGPQALRKAHLYLIGDPRFTEISGHKRNRAMAENDPIPQSLNRESLT